MKFSKIYLSVIISLSLLSSSCMFGYSKRKFKKAKENKPYDIIIVAGYPYNHESGDIDNVMKMRLLWSEYLFKNGFTKNIIYSGSAVYTPYIEAVIMKECALQLGIPDSCIFIETKAEHSTENIANCYKIAKDLGFKKIAFASDPIQTKMMRNFVKRKNIDIDFIPLVVKYVDPKMGIKFNKINTSKAFVKDFISIKKRDSFMKRLRGTLGLEKAD